MSVIIKIRNRLRKLKKFGKILIEVEKLLS